MPRQILIKLTKIKHKEQIRKAAREKQQITHNEQGGKKTNNTQGYSHKDNS